MPATVTPLRPPARSHDPALAASIAELTELGLTVARVTARLAQVEDAALDALAEAAAASTRALATPPTSLDEAFRIGRDADTSEAARDAAVRRVAVIAECFDKAARAVRRAVALQARLASGREFPGFTASGLTPLAAQDHPAPQPSTPRLRRGNDADSPDRPECGDELGTAGDDEVLLGIHHDLSTATTTVAHLTCQPGPAGAAPPPPVHRPAPDQRPGVPGGVHSYVPRPAPDH